MWLLGFVLSLAYVPGIIQGSTTGRWAILAIGLPLLWRPKAWTIGHLLIALWLGYASISLLWTPDLGEGLQQLAFLSFSALAFCLGAEAESLQGFARGAAIGMAINGGVAIAQLLGWHGLWEGPSPGGLFFNKNFLAEAAALTLLLCLLYRDWAYAALCLPAALLPQCREVYLALALALACWLVARRAWIGVAALWAAGAIAAERANPADLWVRFEMWWPTAKHLSILGHGLGSFYVLYPTFGPLVDGRPEYLHNEPLQCIFELGIGALAPSALALWCAYVADARLAALLAALAMACLAYPLHLPFSLCAISLLAGHCAHSRRSLRVLHAKWRGTLYLDTQDAHS